jgi:hypothetical protein
VHVQLQLSYLQLAIELPPTNFENISKTEKKNGEKRSNSPYLPPSGVNNMHTHNNSSPSLNTQSEKNKNSNINNYNNNNNNVNNDVNNNNNNNINNNVNDNEKNKNSKNIKKDAVSILEQVGDFI